MASAPSPTSGKRRLLVLGGGVYQVPLIRRAREMGLETIVVTPQGPYPGINLGHHHWDFDTTDETGILAAARDFGIDAVVTTGTDVCLPALGRLVDELGLCGPSAAAARKSADKTLMKQAFREHGVPTADYEIVASIAAATRAACRIGFPLMVKASDSSGSRGVTKVDSPAFLEAAWQRALAVSRNQRILVEQYLNGVEFGAQAFVTGDKVVAVFPHNDTVTPPPFQTPVGHSMPLEFSPERTEELWSIVSRAVSALGIRNAVCNVDLMLADGRMNVLEIGARMGATCLPENVAVFAGFDVYEHLIRLALGESPEIKTTRNQPNAALLLRAQTSGIVREIRLPDEVAMHPAVVELGVDVKPGDRVRRFQVGPDRIGHIVVKGTDASDAERLATKLADGIVLQVDFTKASE